MYRAQSRPLPARATNPSSPDPLVEDAVQVACIPACDFAAQLDGLFIRGGADEIEGEVADDGHVLGPEALSQAGLVVSLKVTSSTQCRRFSMPQWPRTARPAASAVNGDEEM